MDMLPVNVADGERLALGGDEICVLSGCARTDGAIFAVLLTMQPGGGPPVMHQHAPAEVYHVLEGEFAFYVGSGDGVERIPVGAGEVMPLAGGTPHTIRNETDAIAVAFGVHTPGEAMEGFTRAAARLAEDGEPSMAAVLEIAEKHGIELLGPVPEPSIR